MYIHIITYLWVKLNWPRILPMNVCVFIHSNGWILLHLHGATPLTYIIKVSHNQPHYRRLTVKSVCLLDCQIPCLPWCHPFYGWKPFKCKLVLCTSNRWMNHQVQTISCKYAIQLLISFTINWEILMYENIHVLNVHVNKFLWVPQGRILTWKFFQFYTTEIIVYVMPL